MCTNPGKLALLSLLGNCGRAKSVLQYCGARWRRRRRRAWAATGQLFSFAESNRKPVMLYSSKSLLTLLVDVSFSQSLIKVQQQVKLKHDNVAKSLLLCYHQILERKCSRKIFLYTKKK